MKDCDDLMMLHSVVLYGVIFHLEIDWGCRWSLAYHTCSAHTCCIYFVNKIIFLVWSVCMSVDQWLPKGNRFESSWYLDSFLDKHWWHLPSSVYKKWWLHADKMYWDTKCTGIYLLSLLFFPCLTCLVIMLHNAFHHKPRISLIENYSEFTWIFLCKSMSLHSPVA
jgi:hypothetical protein